MNYYERIQKSIDYIEANLEESIKAEDAAKEAFMSLSGFYRMFFAIAGYSVKEYIRLRRISRAAKEIISGGAKIIDLAAKYAYDSTDSFSRTFKSITGSLPSRYSQGEKIYQFERINVMDKYMEVQDTELLGKYPDIKVLKEMPPMRAAYYCYYGKDPESGAFNVLSKWILKNKIDLNNGEYRIFGYNAPDSNPHGDEYGYEVCLTITENMKVEDEKIKDKYLEGGLYAVMAIPGGKDDLGKEIMKGWQRFRKWLEGSRYVYENRQWLEEHLDFSEEAEHMGGVDLYMPIMLKSSRKIEEAAEEIKAMTVISCTEKGKDAEKKARSYFFSYIKDKGLAFSGKDIYLFASYNFEKIGTEEFCYTLYLSVDNDLAVETGMIIKKEMFQGGLYLKRELDYKNNAQSWIDFIESIKQSRKYSFGNHKFMERYLLKELIINRETKIIQYMPVHK